MSNDPFVDPVSGTGEKVDFGQHSNQLCMIEPRKIEKDVTTQNGVTDAVVADITFIDAPGGVQETLGTFIFTTAIKGKVEDHLGSKVLGRVIQAQSQQGRPYPDLVPASDQDKQTASAYLTHRTQQRQAQQFATPSVPQQAPPQQAPAQQWPPPQQEQPPF